MNAVAARPFRFLLAVLTLWIGARTGITMLPLYGVAGTIPPVPAMVASSIVAPPEARQAGKAIIASADRPSPWFAHAVGRPALHRAGSRTVNWAALDFQSLMASSPQLRLSMAGVAIAGRHFADHGPLASATTALGRGYASGVVTPFFVDWSPGVGGQRAPHAGDRFSMDAWMLVRGGGRGNALSPAGQLGGSQVGARLALALASSISAYGRLSAALETPHAYEAAIGASWLPIASVPVSLNVEHRIALGRGGRNAFAAFAVAGAGPREIAPHVRVEGYAQAGMVGTRTRDAFIDGRITASHDLGSQALAVGVIMAGAAQPHVSRLDIGPRVEATFGPRDVPLRAAVEWRERIAGNARPGSGPALTLATHF